MISKNIRLLHLDNGLYGVGYDSGEVSPGDKRHHYTVLKEIGNPNDARIYATALIDGVNLAVFLEGGKYREPIDPDDIKVCQSFADAVKQEQ